MFKSIFAKYITAFILIITLCFTMITAIAIVSVKSYSRSGKNEVVVNVGTAAVSYIQTQLELEETIDCSSSEDFHKFIELRGDTVSGVLSAIITYSEDVTVLVSDKSGAILMLVDSNGVTYPKGNGISGNELAEFSYTGDIRRVNKIDGIFDAPRIISAYMIKLECGAELGYVFACTEEASLSGISNVMMKTVFISSIWVMLAALIAVYVITNKIIEPLKDMRRAARSFASGDFSVRVRVRGRDEVAELATAFNNMANSLESAEKMRNSFMANVSHDLRTPMTTIAGFVDSILDGAIPPEKHSYYLNIISVEVRRLSRLVSQLLDISRIEAGDRKFNFEPFDVCEMARQILFSFEQKIDKKRLDVEFDSDTDNMYALADRDAIYQIMYNLCDNAVKFSKEGGKLLIGINKNEVGKIVVTIFNEGQGIRKEDMPYVFERFYKEDKSRGLDKSGVGLGLYISKTIIDAHKETISVDSEYGKYCRFSFTLTNAKDTRYDG